jgi:hypothetical protein
MRALLSVWVVLIFVLTGAVPAAVIAVPNLLEYGSNQDSSSLEQEDDSLRPARLRTSGRGRKNKVAWKAMGSPSSAAALIPFSPEAPFQLTATSRPTLPRLYRLLRI